jgi:hypothetical protein
MEPRWQYPLNIFTWDSLQGAGPDFSRVGPEMLKTWDMTYKQVPEM